MLTPAQQSTLKSRWFVSVGVIILALTISLSAALTPSQETTLNANIATSVDLVPNISGCENFDGSPVNTVPNTLDGAFCLAAVYNLTASPAFYVWRTDIPTADVKKAIVWTEYISATSAAERDALNLIISNGIVNGADANIRQGFLDIFSGPQKAVTRVNLTEIAKRLARRAEKLFAVGTGTQAAPATMTFEGNLSYQDVEAARN